METEFRAQRRGFIKALLYGSAGAATALLGLSAACSYNIKNTGVMTASLESFPWKKYVKWFKINKLYNSINPNLEPPQGGGHYSTFRRASYAGGGVTPGIDYSVPSNQVMVAVAPGSFYIKGELPFRAKGNYVKIAHNSAFSSRPTFMSFYAHLGKIFVGDGGRNNTGYIRRGEPIGIIQSEHSKVAKLIINERAIFVDPDNYGPSHTYMEYYDFSYDDFNVTNSGVVPGIDNKLGIQRGLVRRFDRNRIDWDNTKLENMHTSMNHFSTVENFRVMDYLYSIRPDMFPELNIEQVESMRKKFYDNQPILNTLPWVKNGLSLDQLDDYYKKLDSIHRLPSN